MFFSKPAPQLVRFYVILLKILTLQFCWSVFEHTATNNEFSIKMNAISERYSKCMNHKTTKCTLLVQTL